jgi:hypothetical protein
MAAEDSKKRIPNLVGVEKLAERWNVKDSWIYEYLRERCSDPIPHYGLGKYAKFDLDDPELYEWLERRRKPARSVKERGESQRKEKNG